MPIETAVPILAATQAEFHDLDYEMMKHAFAIHGEFGGMLDESIYKAELTRRCRASGMQVEREALIRVRHDTFIKDYRLDILLERSSIVEAKTALQIVQAHHGQTANYLMLANIHHGSLVNFKGISAKREFVSSPQNHEERCRFDTRVTHWPQDEPHRTLRDITLTFCADIGLSLDVQLYRSGFTHLLGGMAAHITEVPILSADTVLGTHPMHLLTGDQALAITCLERPGSFRTNLRKILAHTALKSVSWINLRHHLIEFNEVTH
jgi:GxxExxY protein